MLGAAVAESGRAWNVQTENFQDRRLAIVAHEQPSQFPPRPAVVPFSKHQRRHGASPASTIHAGRRTKTQEIAVRSEVRQNQCGISEPVSLEIETLRHVIH
jgi:hypothetical protein